MTEIDLLKFLRKLRQFKDELPKQTMKTIKGQALAGDLEGAKKGLRTVVRRRAGNCDRAQ